MNTELQKKLEEKKWDMVENMAKNMAEYLSENVRLADVFIKSVVDGGEEYSFNGMDRFYRAEDVNWDIDYIKSLIDHNESSEIDRMDDYTILGFTDYDDIYIIDDYWIEQQISNALDCCYEDDYTTVIDEILVMINSVDTADCEVEMDDEFMSMMADYQELSDKDLAYFIPYIDVSKLEYVDNEDGTPSEPIEVTHKYGIPVVDGLKLSEVLRSM